jgi:hypothetical protein
MYGARSRPTGKYLKYLMERLVIETTPWQRFTSATPSCNLTTGIGFHQLRGQDEIWKTHSFD